MGDRTHLEGVRHSFVIGDTPFAYYIVSKQMKRSDYNESNKISNRIIGRNGR